MAKREKKIIHAGITAEEMELKFAEYAKADAELQRINAVMDKDITKIRERWADKITALGEIKEKCFDVVQAFATENKDVIFTKKKSMEYAHGTIGFRTGTPKLKTLKGFTWNAVTCLLKEFLPAYVRIEETPAKDKLLADRELPEVYENMKKVGISVTQDEAFFIELKKEENNV